MASKIKVWDLPTRLFHWSLAALFGGMWFTGEQGGDWLHYHVLCGEAIGGLLLFRLVWGVAGSDTARFSQFIKGPAAIRRYLKGEMTEAEQPGHNPLGGLMVLALLLALLAQVVSGLFATDVDSYLFDGPLAKLVASGASESITALHKGFFHVLLALVGLHVAAILAYRFIKGKNLVKPMITGRKQVEGEATALRFRPAWLGLATLIVTGGGVMLLLSRL